MTANLPIQLSNALTAGELEQMAKEAVSRKTTLENLTIEAIRVWLAQKTGAANQAELAGAH